SGKKSIRPDVKPTLSSLKKNLIDSKRQNFHGYMKSQSTLASSPLSIYKKQGIHDSFYIGGDQVQVVGKYVKIPNLGWVRLRETLRFEGKINGVTISRRADRWFISVSVETSQLPAVCENQAIVGVDLGIKAFATLSDGKSIPSNQPLKKKLGRL